MRFVISFQQWPVRLTTTAWKSSVHVLGLFEQGILDREAIQFLFELGFVPSSTVDSRALMITNGPANARVSTESSSDRGPATTSNKRQPDDNLAIVTDDRMLSGIFIEDEDDSLIEVPMSSRIGTTELAIAGPTNVLHNANSAVPGVTTLHTNQTLRSLEASAIREKLSQHDSKDKNKKQNSKQTGNGEPTTPVANSQPKSWDVANFPLSMSRYQREFKEIGPLASGSFGSVFRARRELDGYEYAVKKITFDEMGYSNESIEQVIREVQCLAAVNDHPNVVRYYTSWWEPTWMTGSITQKKQKFIENGGRSMKKASKKRFLQIEDGDANDKSEWSAESSTSSSSSHSSDSDEVDYYSLDGGTRSVEESWESYRSHSVEPWNEAYDDSFMTKTESRRRRRSARQSKKNSTATPYQYQISLYIQMQLCHPANLQDWIRERNKQIPESDHETRIGPAVEIFQQICSGLAHIHNSNVVHRDLKPANIFVSSDGKVIKIGDFGLSKKLRDIVNERQTKFKTKAPSSPQQRRPSEQEISYAITPMRTGVSSMQVLVQRNKVGNNLTSGVGTASYAAPEQVQSKTYGTAVDIFSLGLIFLELVSCFETEHERLHNLQQCRYQRLPKWIDEHYPEISSTILSCTSPKACDRPSASELVEVAKLKSPRHQTEVHKLKRQLAEKNNMIAEQNETIENIRVEVENLRGLLLQMKKETSSDQNGKEGSHPKNQREDIVVTDVLSYDDDIE